jgi:cellulose 1,4-beta-cellobiosidase
MFDQTNDYSFDPTKTSYANWTHMTLYQGGTLVWGTEP